MDESVRQMTAPADARPTGQKAEPVVALGTLQANTAPDLVVAASGVATALSGVVERQRLYVLLGGRRYVRVEGWTTLAAMLGIVAREAGMVEGGDGRYVATIDLVRLSDGRVVSTASAECGGPDEPLWQKRPPFSRRSMAATRATGKACRLAFSWVMTLAGYEATPAEEMDGVVPLDDGRDAVPAVRSGTGPDGNAGAATITPAQRRKLYATAKAHGWTDASVGPWLKDRFGVANSAELPRDRFDDVLAGLEAGPEPVPF